MKYTIICVFLTLVTVEGLGRPHLGQLLGNKVSHANKNQQRAEGDIVDSCSSYTDRYVWGQKQTAVTLDDCIYYSCEGKNYVERGCPDGRGVNQGFKNKWNKFKRGAQTSPCTSINRDCKRSLSDKGLSDVKVNLCQMDLIFAIDISCSIAPENRPKVRNFVLQTINALHISPITTQVGGVGFSKRVSHIAYLNEYKYEAGFIRRSKSYARMKFAFRSALNTKGFHWNGQPCGTRGDLALKEISDDYFTATRGDRAGVPNVVIYLSDGVTYPESYKTNTMQQAARLKAAGTTIIVIALPNQMRPMSDGVAEWEAIASEVNGEKFIFMLDSFDKLKVIINDLARKACLNL